METRKGSTSTLRICIFLWFLLCLSRHLSAFSVTVNDIECVYEHVHHEGDTVSGNFAVIDHEIFWSSDHPGIDFDVTTPGGDVIRSSKGTSGDKFEFKAPKRGTYKFCFHNYYSTPESVSFYIHIGHIPTEQDLAKDEHLDPINVKIAKLREALESITAEQQFLKARDSQHRHTNESTRWRLTLYTAAEYLALLAVSGLQVFYIRRLFNKSVAYNKM
ncbi:transmembrane emp24 domain-containing protein p24beta3-like protein [Cinnamomum micranthum f. kanehirae]|uniref:Transmembrane emp24 domain-containing protein p24beta3-like protein n=1 Tax=Cinnamomum micranthum f. kanehirae TaxID=337451 RepID=A0A443NNR6_9MAGN|nr:transmembrane emp24 domain-containing protein p24beta3-like protein [Cinnamomum micranthum f. kanehirae]